MYKVISTDKLVLGWSVIGSVIVAVLIGLGLIECRSRVVRLSFGVVRCFPTSELFCSFS